MKKQIINFDSLPKLSYGILNKDFLNNLPEDFIEIVGKDFNINEMDEKFLNFIMFLFISKKHITKKNFKIMIKNLFEILNNIGVDPLIQKKFRTFLMEDAEIVKEYDNEKYDDLFYELLDCCEVRKGTINMKIWGKFIFM